MSYLTLPYHRLAFKASHASYRRPEDLHRQLNFDAETPGQCGCRGLELDITRHGDCSGGAAIDYFRVAHEPGGRGWPLASYLGLLLSWHLAQPEHDPVFVVVDIENSQGPIAAFPDEFDAYLTEWFDPTLVFTPAQLACDHRLDLCENVRRHGWPEVEEMLGKFVFSLSGAEVWKAFYAEDDPWRRLCFADFDVDGDDPRFQPPARGHRVVANTHLAGGVHADTWRQAVARLRAANFLVRGYVQDSGPLWNFGLAAGVNVLATDQVCGRTWAGVGREPFLES